MNLSVPPLPPQYGTHPANPVQRAAGGIRFGLAQSTYCLYLSEADRQETGYFAQLWNQFKAYLGTAVPPVSQQPVLVAQDFSDYSDFNSFNQERIGYSLNFRG